MKTLAFLFVASLILINVAVAKVGDAPKFKITTKRANDTVEVKGDKDQVVFAIKSPFGISQAVIERQDDSWPKAVVLRLHLKGLENFKASKGKVSLEAAASIQAGKPQVPVWKDGKEDVPLDAKSPFWLDIRMLGSDGKPAQAIPLKDGYFEVTLPRVFFEGQPNSITLSWIDFYRN